MDKEKEQRLYETIGRKQEAYEGLLLDYRNLLATILAMKAGAIDLQTFEVLPGDQWRVQATVPVATEDPKPPESDKAAEPVETLDDAA